jgi:hypothetical protein
MMAFELPILVEVVVTVYILSSEKRGAGRSDNIAVRPVALRSF